MNFLDLLFEQHPALAWLAIILSFTVLAKSADVFVDCAVDIASALKIPKLVIGIVLVSLATTMPELSVSLISAIRGRPEMALGNAIGSVICDDGLALALAGIFSVSPILVIPAVLHLAGGFLILAQIVIFAFIFPDLTLSRGEGAVLVALLAIYTWLLVSGAKRGKFPLDEEHAVPDKAPNRRLPAIWLGFAAALAGIIAASEVIVSSATAIAKSFGIPEAAIALTLVAIGTSIPEIATCVVAARKGHGDVAVGNILGADIMNICWVAGASAVANDLTIRRHEFNFMFPAMIIVVAAMLILLWTRKRFSRRKGIAMLFLYAAYIASFFIFYARH